MLEARQLAGEEVAEGLARDVMVDPVAVDEIHRNIEGVVDVTLESHAVLEDPWQHAGAGIVDVGPDVATIGKKAVRAPFPKR